MKCMFPELYIVISKVDFIKFTYINALCASYIYIYMYFVVESLKYAAIGTPT